MSVEVALFAEDDGHRLLLASLVARVASEEGVEVTVLERHAGGGIGSALSELRRYVRDVVHGFEHFAEILVVGIDTNCQGFSTRSKHVLRVTEGYAGRVVLALPTPHVEKWYLADPWAVASVMGMDYCAEVPPEKCERHRYKQALRAAFLRAGVDPPAGGIEFGDEIAAAMELDRVQGCEDLLDFLQDCGSAIREVAATGRS